MLEKIISTTTKLPLHESLREGLELGVQKIAKLLRINRSRSEDAKRNTKTPKVFPSVVPEESIPSAIPATEIPTQPRLSLNASLNISADDIENLTQAVKAANEIEIKETEAEAEKKLLLLLATQIDSLSRGQLEELSSKLVYEIQTSWITYNDNDQDLIRLHEKSVLVTFIKNHLNNTQDRTKRARMIIEKYLREVFRHSNTTNGPEINLNPSKLSHQRILQ